MKFTKVIKSEKQERHSIDIELLNSIASEMRQTVKFANDMNDAGVKLSAKNNDKIEDAARIIFNKLEEIRNNIM